MRTPSSASGGQPQAPMMMFRPSGEKAISAKLPWPGISSWPVPFPTVQSMTPSWVAAATRVPSRLNASRLTGPPPWSSLTVAPVVASSNATPSSVPTPNCFRSGLSSTVGATLARCRRLSTFPVWAFRKSTFPLQSVSTIRSRPA